MYKFLPILLFAYGFAITTEDIYDNSYALIIGINEYQNVKKLSYAVNDAKAIYNKLINEYDFHNNKVKLLLDMKATNYNIKKEFNSIVMSAGSNDRVLIYFAGHGETMPLPDGGEMGYLIPWEGESNNLYMTSIPMSELKQLSLMSKAKHILYLVDACYSGLATTNYRSLNNEKQSNFISKITNNKSRQIITAGSKDEQVIEKSEWGHSAFTKNLLSGLSYKNADYNSDYIITASELGLYLSERVTIDSDGQQTPKFDRMSMDEGEFVFIINDRNMLTKDEKIIAQLKADNANLRMRLEQLESMQEQSPY